MRDARVSEQPFQIALRKRGEIAVNQSQDRDDDEDTLHLRQHEKRLQHSKQNDETGGFRTDGKKSGHRRRRALINIRHPDLKWHGGDLETERDQHQDHPEKRRHRFNVTSR